MKKQKTAKEVEEIRQQLIDTVDYLRTITGKTQIEISKIAQYKDENTLAQAISRKDQGHSAVLRRLRVYFNDILKNSTPEEIKKVAEKRRMADMSELNLEITERSSVQNSNSDDLSSLIATHKVLVDTLKVFADAHLKFANSAEIEVNTNKELVSMLKNERSTADSQKETHQDAVSIPGGFQAFVLEIAAGKRYKTKDEAAAALLDRIGRAVPKKEHV